MFAVRNDGGTITGEPGYNYWVGTQQFSQEVNALYYADGVMVIGLGDGRMLKVRGVGGTGTNMFAVQESDDGFETVQGYDYLAGSQRLRSSVVGLYPAAGVLFVALNDGTLLKVNGTGGTGKNMLAVREQDGTYVGEPDYNYWVGTQQFQDVVYALYYADGVTVIGLTDGRMLKVRGVGGTGTNMFAVQESDDGFETVQGYDYLVGSQRLRSAVLGLYPAAGVLFVALNDGTLLKVNGTGGTGKNMLAVREQDGTYVGEPDHNPYWVGTQQFSHQVSALCYADGVTVIGLTDGRMLKVRGVGGTGTNMFAVQESDDGFETVQGYDYLVGSQRLRSAAWGLYPAAGVLFVALYDGTLLKVNGTGGTGKNMLAVREQDGTYVGEPGYNYWVGTQQLPATVPGAPTIGTATGGNAQATVSFTAPASNGGSTITSYTVISNPDGKTATGSASPLTVTGLTNGTSYTFTVTATNSVGTGAPSTASNAVTPATVPGAPTIGAATAGNAQATVNFTAPASNGGSAVTSYTVTSIPGGKTATGSASPLTVTGLTNGTSYTFTVTATNSVGTGAPSAASNAVTPVSTPQAVLVVVNTWTEPTIPGAGEPFTVYSEFCNTGTKASDKFSIRFELDGNRDRTTIPCSGLQPNECEKAGWSFNSGLPAGNHYFYVYLDPGGQNFGYAGVIVGP